MGITLPPNGFKLNTYEQYISPYEANIMKSKANHIISLKCRFQIVTQTNLSLRWKQTQDAEGRPVAAQGGSRG